MEPRLLAGYGTFGTFQLKSGFPSLPEPKLHANSAARQKAYRARQAAVRRVEQAAKGLPALAGIPTMPSLGRWRAMKSNALKHVNHLLTKDRIMFYSLSVSHRTLTTWLGLGASIRATTCTIDRD